MLVVNSSGRLSIQRLVFSSLVSFKRFIKTQTEKINFVLENSHLKNITDLFLFEKKNGASSICNHLLIGVPTRSLRWDRCRSRRGRRRVSGPCWARALSAPDDRRCTGRASEWRRHAATGSAQPCLARPPSTSPRDARYRCLACRTFLRTHKCGLCIFIFFCSLWECKPRI